MRLGIYSVLTGFAIALIAALSPAFAWEIKAMNRQIEQTNVIVSGVCSGTIIDVKNRLVLTAYHCVADNIREVQKREVTPSGEIRVKTVQERTPAYVETWKRQDFEVVSSERHTAIIKGFDKSVDVAILQVVDTNWKPVEAAPFARDDYPYLRGQIVYAVGNPGVVFENSITTGIISAPARKLDFGDGTKIPLFQHSASVIGGNSGGGIYNDNGELIGTLTGGVRGADISLAVPISFTKALLTKIGHGDILPK